jgi:hypothetical protein
MRTVLGFLATILFSCALIGPAVAQQRSPGDTPIPPRGVEGPEMRKQAPKDTGAVEPPTTQKKGTRARGQKPQDTPPPPTGVEGPEIRKQAPKGTGGAATPSTDKKDTRAKSPKPRHTDSPPKVKAEPEIKQDRGKKIQ